MTRIATNSAQQSALADIMRAQRELNLAQSQYSSGKRATDLKGLAAHADTLTATRSVLARETSYVEAGKQIKAKLEAQALAIGEVSDVAAELRQAITESLGLDDGSALVARIEDMVSRTASALNTKFGGTYLFGGGRDQAPPFAASSLADLAGASPAASLFRNGDIRAVAKLQDGAAMETGILADELAGDLVAAMDRIKDFADGAGGAFSDPLTAAERTFLTGEIANVSAAFERITTLEASNGIAQNKVDTAVDRAGERAATLEILLSDMEDADMAEVATRLQQAQLALEASAQAFSLLSRTTLLDYLR